MNGIGGPEVYSIQEMPVPEPGEGEVQVAVDGAGINPSDWKAREGVFNVAKAFPAVALREFSGVVSKLGPGVTGFEVGDGVYGISKFGFGAAAEYTIALASEIGLRPTTMDPADAAIVPQGGQTAMQALFNHGNIERGQRVLIHGAGGGVGSYAVQLAKWKGAHVIGTASADHHHVIHELGADELIDYHTQKFDEIVSDVDLVLHTIGQDQVPASLKVLKPGGRLVVISADPMAEEAKAQGKTAVGFSMKSNTADLRALSDLVIDLRVKPLLDTVVPMEKAKEAIMELQRGHILGKMAVRIA